MKNLNSIRSLRRAIDFEASRQIDIYEGGGAIAPQTRLFNVASGETVLMRNKEDAGDYRYFPEPDLPPLYVSDEEQAKLRSRMPELPEARKLRFMQDMTLPMDKALLLADDNDIAAFFEEAVRHSPKNAVRIANLITGEMFALLNKYTVTVHESKITSAHLAQLTDLVAEGIISGTAAKEVFALMWETGKEPHIIVREEKLEQITDSEALMETVSAVLKDNAAEVQAYVGGKEKLFGFFVGETMKRMAGRGDPKLVRDCLMQELLKRKENG